MRGQPDRQSRRRAARSSARRRRRRSDTRRSRCRPCRTRSRSGSPPRRATRAAPTAPAAGPGDEDERGMRRRLVHRRDAARRAHDERLGQTGLGRRRRERPQIAGRDGTEVRVGGGRRRSFVLTELRRDLVRRHDVRVRQPAAQLVRDGALVLGVAVRVQEAHRDRLRVEVRQRAQVESARGRRPGPSAHARRRSARAAPTPRGGQRTADRDVRASAAAGGAGARSPPCRRTPCARPCARAARSSRPSCRG